MPTVRWDQLPRLMALLAGLLILKVTASVVLGYRDYFPPNFDADFLLGRQSYFFGAYRWAFYAHLVAGPVTLLLGLVLISESFRQRFPKGHRSLGKLQIAIVLLLLVPSGLWLSRYAMLGPIAATGFAALAMATGTCAAYGWRTAVQRRFVEHRRWMLRCYLLLCSAVVLRLIGGLATVTAWGGIWAYPLAAWISWMLPLALFELSETMRRRRFSARTPVYDQSKSLSSALSFPAAEISARRSAAGKSS